MRVGAEVENQCQLQSRSQLETASPTNSVQVKTGMMIGQSKDKNSPATIFAAGEAAEFCRDGGRIVFAKQRPASLIGPVERARRRADESRAR